MRILLNCFGFLKPATIITERELFSECQIALFVADICHFNYQIKKTRLQNKLRSDFHKNKNLFCLIKNDTNLIYQLKETA